MMTTLEIRVRVLWDTQRIEHGQGSTRSVREPVPTNPNPNPRKFYFFRFVGK